MNSRKLLVAATALSFVFVALQRSADFGADVSGSPARAGTTGNFGQLGNGQPARRQPTVARCCHPEDARSMPPASQGPGASHRRTQERGELKAVGAITAADFGCLAAAG
jgi:hypothetical protein